MSRRSAELEDTVLRLVEWFRRAARDLPWRHDRSGYSALVAEAMLQQTQVARVLEKYESFMARFPSVADLAAADEQEVLAAWQGLGYYRRARHLHAAARMIVNDLGGEIPVSVEDLLKLPGVGRYTAGSIASIVFGQCAPIVDGNVQRVLARLFAQSGNPVDPATIRWMWERATALAEAAHGDGCVGEFNEAMMELGAILCTPAAPKCLHCPLVETCEAARTGRQDELPPAKPAAKQKAVHHHAVIIRRDDGRLLLEQRPENGLWSKMWQTPTIERDAPVDSATLGEALRLPVTDLCLRESFPHQTTHRSITFHVFEGTIAEEIDLNALDERIWRAPVDVGDLPLSNPQRRIVESVMPGAMTSRVT